MIEQLGRNFRPTDSTTTQARSRRRGLSVFALLAMFGLLVTTLAAPLAAQDTDIVTPNEVDFEVLRVDLRETQGVVAVRPAGGAESTDLIVEVEGEEVTASPLSIHRSSVDLYTILVIDNSETANSVAGWSRIQQSALAFMDNIGSDTRVMLVAAGGGSLEIRPELNFTSNHAAIKDAISNMGPEGGAVTWNAIADSVASFDSQGDGLRNVVAFIGSPGLASSVGSNAAKGNLLSRNASFTVVAPQAANLDLAPWTNVASATRGGAVFRGTADADMAVAGRNAARTQESYIVGTFDASGVVDATATATEGAPDATSEVTVRFGGSSERVRVVPDSAITGSGLTAPPIIETSRFAILRGNNGALFAIGLAIVAVLLFSFSMMQILGGTDNSLNSTLSVYGSQDRTEEQRVADEAFASQRSKIIEQVVEKAEEAAASRGNLKTTTTLLEKAEIPLRVGEAFAIQAGLVIVAVLLGLVVIGNPFIALGLAVPAGFFPILFVKFKVSRRAKKLESQLPDTLNLLSSTLKAGYSFIQGIDAVGNEAEEPLAGEFRRTVNEARLGKEMDIALDDLADRVDSVDLLWAIVAIKIQREVGGNLAELLSTVADTMTSRARLRGEVSALTAEGRMSAMVLLGLPFGVGFAMYFMNRQYISTLWESSIGYGAMGLAAVSMVVGAIWMRKIIDIEI